MGRIIRPDLDASALPGLRLVCRLLIPASMIYRTVLTPELKYKNMFKVTYVIGACLAALGLIALIAAWGGSSQELLLAVGSSVFSLGALIIGAGFYLHGRKLKAEFQVNAPKEKKTDRKTERMCSVCNQEAAQVFCRVHVLRLCSNCLENHDDGRNCLYVPAKRAAAAYK
jgi:hypothetical protein